ncbi:hypothetical protein [Paenibacillus alba]|uniref:Uncharacterized protein n=1 Tax=Paenibacillus alba TaxID=1197127 RepID=A0ABU6GAX1_9BACL|nr:hypothetical protein [Paenibacillus alba]MEC0231287.1 hypothetical protein [Paenibacillus alba]
MAVTPLQGYDVSVTVIGPNGPDLVGEFEEMDLTIAHDVDEYQTLNSRMPILLDGEVKLDGTLKRGMIDVGKSLQVLFGSASLSPGQVFTSPRYIISVNFNNATKGLVGRYTLTGCIFLDFNLSASKGKSVVNSSFKFRAQGIQEA